MKKLFRKANAVLACVIALTLVVGFFSCIKVSAAGTTFTHGNGRIKVLVTVKDKNTGKAIQGEEVTIRFIDFTGEVEEILADGYNAILDALGEDENSIWRWNVSHTKIGTATTDASGVATFKLDSTVDWLWYYEVAANDDYYGAYNRLTYLPYGRLGIVIPGLLQRGLTVSVCPKEKEQPTPVNPDQPTDPAQPDNPGGGDNGGNGNGDNGGNGNGDNGGNGNGGGSDVVIPGGGSEVPGGGGSTPGGPSGPSNPSGPSFPSESSWGDVVEPDMEEVEPVIVDIMDDTQSLGDAVNNDPDPQVVTYEGDKKDKPAKVVAKNDTTPAPAADTDDTQYADLDDDAAARGDTEILPDEAKEEKKETVNFVAKVDDTKKDEAPAVAPASTEVKEEIVEALTGNQPEEGVSLKFWLLWIIIGVALAGGGVTIYLKRRR